jgi:hypothetical protein
VPDQALAGGSSSTVIGVAPPLDRSKIRRSPIVAVEPRS